VADRDDVRGFYAALGIVLPAGAHRNATIRCFADPDAHAHGDRNPSCSVSLDHGAWRCWACGAHGGAYDAALTRGHTPASAMALLDEHRLADPRRPPFATSPSPTRFGDREPNPGRPNVTLAATETHVQAWHDALFSPDAQAWLDLLCRERLWSASVMRDLHVGRDRERITIPIHNAAGRLRGVLRYHPGASTPKMLAVRGTQLGLIPHPAHQPSQRILLVEGPPDMIAARSRGWPAIAVPGTHAWNTSWSALLTGRDVTVLFDSDTAGRAAAQQIAHDLTPYAAVRIVDLAPNRDDGYDLTDWLHAQPQRRSTPCAPSSSPKPTIAH
jgi:hypothetical protein